MKRWKWWLPAVAFLGLLFWWVNQGLQGSLLILKNEDVITADDVWASNDRVFYKQGITIQAIESRRVRQIVTGSWTDPTCYLPLLTAHFHNSIASLSNQKFSSAWTGVSQHPFFLQIKPQLPIVAESFLGLLLFLLGVRGWREHRRKRAAPTDAAPDDLFLRLADFSDVESLFLSLYKKKLGAPVSAPAEIEKAPRKDGWPGKVLNLKVLHEGKWQSRRMSLAPIGEGTGSKSQCFYVIFDTHMVIKIPPAPITDFDEYIDRVQAETEIMQQLAPRVCVIPNLAVILSRIHSFPDAEEIPPSQLEDRYVRWLRKFPDNQRYLTIGGSFVFFMDLARYYFLSHVADGFHAVEAGLNEEVRADVEVLSDLALFEGKYGPRGAELWPALHKTYETFREHLEGALVQTEEQVSFSDWNKKELYLGLMAGRDANLANLKGSPQFKALLQDRLARADTGDAMLKQRYQQLMRHYTETRLFQRSRPLMGNMVTNLLNLLAWLDKKQISLRDLKPDNLLVAGNPDDYPHFMTAAKNFTIGLIDLETAVDLRSAEKGEIQQPQLGGTPLYCTPSHFFPNKLLKTLYTDLAPVYHLQDWYAMIAIIFSAITGDPLFKGTAYQIPMMMKAVMQTAARKGNLKKKFLHFSRQFQDNATVEAREKFKLHRNRLQSVRAHIPDKVKQRLLAHIKAEWRQSNHQLKKLLANQAAFKKDDVRRRLEKSSLEELQKLRAGYQKRAGGEKLVGQLNELIRLRQKIDTLSNSGRQLAGKFPKVSIDILLKRMFALVKTELLAGLDLPAAKPAQDLPGPEHASAEELESTNRVLGYSATIHLPSDG